MEKASIIRTRSDFKSWVEPGARFLAEHIANKATDEIKLDSKSSSGMLSLIPDDFLSIILPMAIKEVEEKFLMDKLEILADNLEMIYGANPNITQKDAIKIAFSVGSLVRAFGEECINNAISKC